LNFGLALAWLWPSLSLWFKPKALDGPSVEQGASRQMGQIEALATWIAVIVVWSPLLRRGKGCEGDSEVGITPCRRQGMMALLNGERPAERRKRY
jgi:hypothetical protein